MKDNGTFRPVIWNSQRRTLCDRTLVTIGLFRNDINELGRSTLRLKLHFVRFTRLEFDPGSPQFYTPELQADFGDDNHHRLLTARRISVNARMGFRVLNYLQMKLIHIDFVLLSAGGLQGN